MPQIILYGLTDTFRTPECCHFIVLGRINKSHRVMLEREFSDILKYGLDLQAIKDRVLIIESKSKESISKKGAEDQAMLDLLTEKCTREKNENTK